MAQTRTMSDWPHRRFRNHRIFETFGQRSKCSL
jgi:hypothetical protein